ncbi:hypothetical protein OE09_0902 [Flavobacteriaceae bacterium MAR_2010_72]|nr:hypothetical protein OE09_0902 [Flavobacteriaceae bacterium MAR_2010_72]
MKSIKIFLLVAVFAFSSALYAGSNPSNDAPTVISNEIGKLLKNPNFKVDKELFANVKILFNQDNEIVVLSVDSKDKGIDTYIKGRLNYNKLSVDVNNKNRYYIVPVRITAKQ